MKLLLTSAAWEHNISIGNEFLKLVGKKPADIRIFYVLTPSKYTKRNKYLRRLFKKSGVVNIPKENITFFSLDKKVTNHDLKGIDVIFVSGGNTFEYLDGLRKTGLDKLIKSFVKKGGVYVGLSAGSYVACPNIEAASWKHADRNELGLQNLKGLNLVPFLITAHFEKALRKTIEDASKTTNYPVVALNDKQAVLVNEGNVKVVGIGKRHTFNFPNTLC